MVGREHFVEDQPVEIAVEIDAREVGADGIDAEGDDDRKDVEHLLDLVWHLDLVHRVDLVAMR